MMQTSEDMEQQTLQTEPIPMASSDHTTDSVDQPEYFKTNKKKMQIFPILGVVALLMGTLVILASTQKPQDVRSRATLIGPTLALAPATKTAKIGETYSLGMTINTNTDTVSAGEFHLAYDKTALEIVSFSPGTVLPIVLVPETHANGAIAVTLGAQPTSPLKGAGVIGTWNVKILAAKQSTITITSATQVAALGKTTNALATATGASITGTTANGPTPTPTPTPIGAPTATPTPTPNIGAPTATPTPTPNYQAPTATPTPMTYAPNNTPTPTPQTYTKPDLGFGNIAVTATPTPYNNTQTPGSIAIVPQPTDYTVANQLPQTNTYVPPTTPRGSEEEIPTTNVFQRILTGVLQFFQRLFHK